MPHIVVTALEGMPAAKKRALAKDIAGALCANFNLPQEMVEKDIQFADISLENYAPARDFGPDDPPPPVKYIAISIIKGLTVEQKRSIARDITKAVARNTGLPDDSPEIALEINEAEKSNVSHGGMLTLDSQPPWVPQA